MLIMMVMVVIMSMTMRRMIMRGVLLNLSFRGRMSAGLISAAFGIERRLDLDDPRAEPLQHLRDDVVTPDTQRLLGDLRRQMAVSEVPGEPDHVLRVAALDLDQRLGGGHDLDQAAVVEQQRIASTQRDRLFQVEQEFEPARADHRHPPPVPVIEIEHDGIGRGFAPAVLRLDLGGAHHRDILCSLL
jgi:hypothetical protein